MATSLDFAALLKAERAKARSPASHSGPPPSATSEQAVRRQRETPKACSYILPFRDDRPRFLAEVHGVATPAISGVAHVQHWLSAVEEAELLRCADTVPNSAWTTLRGRRLQQFGGQPVSPPEQMVQEPLPGWVQSVCDALVAAGVFPEDAPPNHVLLNEYQPGQGIEHHKDGPLYLPLVAIVSLGSHAAFEFLEEDTRRRPLARLLLPRRGLLVFDGEAYTNALHGVTRATEDDPSTLLCLDAAATGTPSTEVAEATEATEATEVTEATEAAETAGAAGATRACSLPRGRRISLTVRHVLAGGDGHAEAHAAAERLHAVPRKEAVVKEGAVRDEVVMKRAVKDEPSSVQIEAPRECAAPSPLPDDSSRRSAGFNNTADASRHARFERLLDLLPNDDAPVLLPLHPDVDTRRPLTYAGLCQLSQRVCEQLGLAGDAHAAEPTVRPHERVALSLPSCPELAACFLALSGAVAVAPLNPELADDEVRAVRGNADCA